MRRRDEEDWGDSNQKPNADSSSMNRRSEEPGSDPFIAKVLFGLLLSVLVASEAALLSGLATIPDSWP
jgi:hypothetical protein